MNERIQSCFKGIYVAVLAVVIYAVALGCFISLMLLVISMEEGGSLSSLSLGMTSAVVLLSQGIGFTSGSFLITLIPLSLSVSLVLLIRALAVKIGSSWFGFLSGLVIWLSLFAVVLHASSYTLLLPLGLQLTCIAVVFSFGYLWALLPRDEFTASKLEQFQHTFSKTLRSSIWLSLRVWLSAMVVLLICGTATVIVWIVLNASTMGTLFSVNNMGSGSRIMTTLATLAWLPNICLWAISWLSGAGFSIGSSAQFSLWSGQSTDLPPVPAFGLLPSALDDDLMRLLCVSVPTVIAFILGMLVLLHPKGFRVLQQSTKQHSSLLTIDTLKTFLYPALSFCLVSILTALSSATAFSLSNGALGSNKLAHVGVDVAQTTSTLVHSIALGLAISWVLVLLLFCARFGLKWFLEEINNRADISHSLTDLSQDELDDNDSMQHDHDENVHGMDNEVHDNNTSKSTASKRQQQGRVISGTSGKQHGTEAFNLPTDSNPHSKEEQ